jgi:hypothetical protein
VQLSFSLFFSSSLADRWGPAVGTSPYLQQRLCKTPFDGRRPLPPRVNRAPAIKHPNQSTVKFGPHSPPSIPYSSPQSIGPLIEIKAMAINGRSPLRAAPPPLLTLFKHG